MKVAFVPVRRVISNAHIVVLGQSAGRMRGRTMDDQRAYFFYANQEPPPLCVRWAGMRASGMRSGWDGAFAGW